MSSLRRIRRTSGTSTIVTRTPRTALPSVYSAASRMLAISSRPNLLMCLLLPWPAALDSSCDLTQGLFLVSVEVFPAHFRVNKQQEDWPVEIDKEVDHPDATALACAFSLPSDFPDTARLRNDVARRGISRDVVNKVVAFLV